MNKVDYEQKVWLLKNGEFIHIPLWNALEHENPHIPKCGLCNKYAIALDPFAPYMQQRNRCKEHLKG
jgi:hypothetical protein